MFPINETPLTITPLADENDPNNRFVTYVVKGTFSLANDGSLTPLPAEQQPVPQPEVQYMDDLGRSIKTPTEFVHWKPYTDLIFVGSCHAPGGEPHRHCDAVFGLGAHRKRIRVVGDRHWWSDETGMSRMSAPKPFTEMPIRLENSFGGLSSMWNMYGKGLDPIPDPEDPGREIWPLPNLEDPTHPVRSPEDRPAPICFAPVPSHFHPRVDKQGTRDLRWATFRAPLPPHDYDPGFENTAPEDQQFKEVKGDEWLTLVNLHPDRAELSVQLPGKRVRLFYASHDDPDRKLTEIPVRLDTIIVNVPERQVVLNWRGSVNVGEREPQRELFYVYLTWENLAEDAEPREAFQPSFDAQTAEVAEVLRDMEADVDEKLEEQTANIKEQILNAFKQAEMDPALIQAIASSSSLHSMRAAVEDAAQSEIKKMEEIKAELETYKESYAAGRRPGASTGRSTSGTSGSGV
jgi:hypothetical protein